MEDASLRSDAACRAGYLLSRAHSKWPPKPRRSRNDPHSLATGTIVRANELLDGAIEALGYFDIREVT
jgi:hypothetical protein